MRSLSFGLRFQTALSMTLVATSLGCGACTDEHAHDPAAAPQMTAVARAAANTELRAHCTAGLSPPAEAYAAITEIPPLGNGLVFMQDINDDGVAVGSALEDIGHAFLYDSRAAHPALLDLNSRAKTPGWVLRGANDVNDAFVVGYGLHEGQSHGFRMSLATGQVDDLGTLAGAPSVGWAVDTSGDVVGWVAKDAHTNVAVVYFGGLGAGLGGLHALNDYVDPSQGWELQQANGINSHGAIVGMASHQGVPVGFKLTLPSCRGP